MIEIYDIFLCYRRKGAQTAKLFKRYWKHKAWPGEVWYSDSESHGSYMADIKQLVSNAKACVIFISDDFTEGFLDENNELNKKCVTVHEIIEIARTKMLDDDFRIITVNLDGHALNRTQASVIQRALDIVGLPEHCVDYFTQRNRNIFLTDRDDEDAFFESISSHLLPDDFYKNHIIGDFCLGTFKTSVDLIAWDKKSALSPDRIVFQMYDEEIDFHKTISRIKTDARKSLQNDIMISVVKCDTYYLKDKELQVVVTYKTVEYHLFEKTIFLRNDPRLYMNRKLCEYTDSHSIFQIPNAMGMAFMVITSDKKLIFSRRSADRRIRRLEYDCSIVEGMKLNDQITIDGQIREYGIDDSEFVECEVRRAYLEEICPDASDIRIKISGIILDKEYAQWNIVGTIFTDKTQAEIEQLSAKRYDLYERRQLLFVPYTDENGNPSLANVFKALTEFRAQKMWSTAFAAVYAALMSLGFQDKDISEYIEH